MDWRRGLYAHLELLLELLRVAVEMNVQVGRVLDSVRHLHLKYLPWEVQASEPILDSLDESSAAIILFVDDINFLQAVDVLGLENLRMVGPWYAG